MKEPLIVILIITLAYIEISASVPLFPKSTSDKPAHQENDLFYYLSKTPKFRSSIDQNNVVKMEAGTVFRDSKFKIVLDTKLKKNAQKGNYQILKSEEKEGSFVNRMECSVCKLVVMLVQSLMAQGKTRDEIAAALTVVCTQLHIEDKRVCDSIIKEFKVRPPLVKKLFPV